jgi:FkbM family methyltransferase
MSAKIRLYSSIMLRKLGNLLIALSQRILNKRSRLVAKGDERSLYLTSSKDLFWLNKTGYIDQTIIEKGEFEPQSTEAIKRLVKQGNLVLDIGANIGYYSVKLSKLVGNSGKVIAFEPTEHFRKTLRMNLDANNITNVEVINIGLSDKEQKLEIDIGPSSATLHSPLGFDDIESKEVINLTTLDSFVQKHNIPKIDFIKIDVDGHEPFFFEGAWKSLNIYDPIVLLEVSHLHYLEAGFTAWDFYDSLKRNKYRIYHEDQFVEMKTKEDFLRSCANFAYSSNIIISRRELLI